jgi:hypothetical protein
MIVVRFPAGARNFSLRHRVHKPDLGSTQPPIQRVPEAFTWGVKRPGREADHSLPSAKVREYVELYLYSPNMSRRGALLSTGTTSLFLPFTVLVSTRGPPICFVWPTYIFVTLLHSI